MSLLVLAYPQIEKNDYEWIQSIREKDDERYYSIVAPHFTFVFPVYDMEKSIFVNHVLNITKKFKEFYFVLRCAQVVKDSLSDYYDVFLIPEEGYRIIVKLHDALYTGPLSNHLRLDIPFVPHVGIANNRDAYQSKNIADQINKSNLEIVGAINRLNIVSYENNKIETVREILLK